VTENGSPRQQSLPVLAPLPDRGLLLELGRQRRSQIKRLKRGRGRLTRQITDAVTQACEGLGIDPRSEVIPVVILYRRRPDDYRVSYAGG
jgi:hypothetical protein